MPNLAPEQKELVRRECEGLAGRERTHRVQEMSVKLNVHPSTIYRALPRNGRQRRADRAQEKCDLPADLLKQMLALSARDLPASQVIEVAILNGWIAPGQISEPTYNRYLAKRQISARQRARSLRPHVRFEESFANERHYLDISGFEDYFVDVDGSIGFEGVLQHSKNRPGNRKPRIQFFLIVDGYSRAKYARFYLGKSALNWLDFLIRGWSPKTDLYTNPFQGRPLHLYSDKEGIFGTPLIKRFLAAMDVEYHHHLPGESRAKGKVERPIGDLESKLAHLLRLKLPAKFLLDEANAFLEDYLYRENGRRHGTTHQEPMQRWRAGFHQQRPLRLMPEPAILQRFFYTQDERVIAGDLTLQLQGRKWQLPRKDPFLSWAGHPVAVFYHPGEELSSIFVVIDDVEYEVTHSTPAPQVAGEYRSLPVSDREKLLQELEQVDLSDIQIDGYKERYAKPDFLPAAGEALDTEALALPRRAISKRQLIRRLQQEGVCAIPITTEHKAHIDRLYLHDQQVYEDQLDQIIADLTGSNDRMVIGL